MGGIHVVLSNINVSQNSHLFVVAGSFKIGSSEINSSQPVILSEINGSGRVISYLSLIYLIILLLLSLNTFILSQLFFVPNVLRLCIKTWGCKFGGIKWILYFILVYMFCITLKITVDLFYNSTKLGSHALLWVLIIGYRHKCEYNQPHPCSSGSGHAPSHSKSHKAVPSPPPLFVSIELTIFANSLFTMTLFFCP